LSLVFSLTVGLSSVNPLDMPRRLRIDFDGAIDHVTMQGNARQKIGSDDANRRRLVMGLENTVVRHGWELVWSRRRVPGPETDKPPRWLNSTVWTTRRCRGVTTLSAPSLGSGDGA
jgi:hypothetical protein